MNAAAVLKYEKFFGKRGNVVIILSIDNNITFFVRVSCFGGFYTRTISKCLQTEIIMIQALHKTVLILCSFNSRNYLQTLKMILKRY